MQNDVAIPEAPADIDGFRSTRDSPCFDRRERHLAMTAHNEYLFIPPHQQNRAMAETVYLLVCDTVSVAAVFFRVRCNRVSVSDHWVTTEWPLSDHWMTTEWPLTHRALLCKDAPSNILATCAMSTAIVIQRAKTSQLQILLLHSSHINVCDLSEYLQRYHGNRVCWRCLDSSHGNGACKSRRLLSALKNVHKNPFNAVLSCSGITVKTQSVTLHCDWTSIIKCLKRLPTEKWH